MLATRASEHSPLIMDFREIARVQITGGDTNIRPDEHRTRTQKVRDPLPPPTAVLRGMRYRESLRRQYDPRGRLSSGETDSRDGRTGAGNRARSLQ